MSTRPIESYFIRNPKPQPSTAQAPPVPKEGKERSAFDVLRWKVEPKKVKPCQMPECKQVAYLVLGETTCKCQKVFCRQHFPKEQHQCTYDWTTK